MNDSLADIDKFTYLKSFLSDSDLQSTNDLSLNATNYKEAIEILHERYEKKQVLITAHIEKLEKLPRMKPWQLLILDKKRMMIIASRLNLGKWSTVCIFRSLC